MSKLNNIEKLVLQKLLHGEHPFLTCLKSQLFDITEVHREYTGAGFYSRFTVSEKVQRIQGRNFKFGDVSAKIDGLAFGVGFLLYVEDGVLSMLEAYTYGEDWPHEMKNVMVDYLHGVRNLDCLD